MDDVRGDTEVAVGAGKEIAALALAQKEIGGRPFVIVPDGFKVEELTHLLARPVRRRDDRLFTEPDSFARYVKAFMGEHSLLFGSRDEAKLLAVLDYHDPGAEGAARWGDFRARLELPLDPDWVEWKSNDNKLLGQAEFAQFIEDRVPNIISPDAADLLEVAQHLEMNTNVAFKSATRLTDGRRALRFEETTQGKVGVGDIEIPSEIRIRVPIYRWARPEEIVAKLRYRIMEGRLTLGYRLHRPFDAVDRAFKSVLEAIEVETGLRTLHAKV